MISVNGYRDNQLPKFLNQCYISMWNNKVHTNHIPLLPTYYMERGKPPQILTMGMVIEGSLSLRWTIRNFKSHQSDGEQATFLSKSKKTWKVTDNWNNSFLVDNMSHSYYKRGSLHIGNTFQIIKQNGLTNLQIRTWTLVQSCPITTFNPCLPNIGLQILCFVSIFYICNT